VKAITLWQPWASLIALGAKTIETRGHAGFRGLKGQRIAIHAGARFDGNAAIVAARVIVQQSAQANPDEPNWWPIVVTPSLNARGAVVCTAFVADAAWMTERLERQALCPTAGRFGLFLEDIQVVDPPARCAGQRGIWEWEPTERKGGTERVEDEGRGGLF